MLKPSITAKLFLSSMLICGMLSVQSFADSQARIVRLSVVDGDVQVDRNTGQGFEKAFLNLPITEGAKLRANKDARAEVEFEDGSTLRITPDTVVEFNELSLRDSGGKVSKVNLQSGTAYVNFAGAKDDDFRLDFGHETVALTSAAHIRVGVQDTDATLAVFKGDVQVDGPSGTVQVSSKQTATFDLTDSDRSTLAKNLESDPYDSWDKEQAQYHERYFNNSSYNSSYASNYGYGYGVSDLNYYGSYFNAPGYGLLWQPYFTGAGWDPFMNGSWVYYPGYGYTWVSAYPWGWMPYRYGNWTYIAGRGWGWQAGQPHRGWNTVPLVVNAPHGFVGLQPPSGSGRTTVVVNRGPLPSTGGNRVVIRNDSAGMGIPRGSIRDIGKVSREVTTRGSVTTTVHPVPAPRPVQPIQHTVAPTRTAAPARMSPTPHVTPPPHVTPHR